VCCFPNLYLQTLPPLCLYHPTQKRDDCGLRSSMKEFTPFRLDTARPALTAALAHDGPALVEVLVNRQELSMPPMMNLDRALGLSLYMIRAVLTGRGDEVIDLAKTKLMR
jgi:hypothetical protein